MQLYFCVLITHTIIEHFDNNIERISSNGKINLSIILCVDFAMITRINIFDYSDACRFLTDAYADLREQNPKVSYRYLQKKAGYSPKSNHYWQVAAGRVPLSRRAAARFAKALGLVGDASSYLLLLAEFAQAKTDEERSLLARKITRLRRRQIHQDKSQIPHDYYAEWYLPALREVVNLSDFREDAAWIGRRLVPRLSAKQVKDGLAKLEQLGFLQRDENGRLQQVEALIGSVNNRRDPDALSRLAVRNFHRHMIGLAGQSLDNQTQDQRLVTGITASVSLDQLERLHSLALEMLAKAQEIIQEDEPVDVVARLNVQLFQLVRPEPANSIPKPKDHHKRG